MPETKTTETSSIAARTEGGRKLTQRWKHEEIFAQGFVAVPTVFLRHYAHLKPHRLTLGEMLFVLHLMEFKWDAKAPFPGYATLAKRMGISIKMARRHAQKLEAKKYLKREIRAGLTNRFDLSPLFDALLLAAQAEERTARAKRKRADYGDEMIEWLNNMIVAYGRMTESERSELAKWEKANLDGEKVGTSDWPGWEELIGKKPKG